MLIFCTLLKLQNCDKQLPDYTNNPWVHTKEGEELARYVSQSVTGPKKCLPGSKRQPAVSWWRETLNLREGYAAENNEKARLRTCLITCPVSAAILQSLTRAGATKMAYHYIIVVSLSTLLNSPLILRYSINMMRNFDGGRKVNSPRLEPAK